MESKSGNIVKVKPAILLNGAGDSSTNYIVRGLPLAIEIRLNVLGCIPTATLNGVNIPLTNSVNPYIYKYTGTTGIGPLNINGYGRLRVQVKEQGFKIAEYEKMLYIMSPVNLIEVYANGAWNNSGGIYGCTSNCPIRFLNGSYDDFGKKHFGGVRYVSVYDQGTLENSDSSVYVIRMIEIPIEQMRVIYLVKNLIGQVEMHYLTFALKTKKGGSALIVNRNFYSVACLGLIPKLVEENTNIQDWLNFWNERQLE